MELTLLTITLVATILATVASTVAWRLVRTDRRRSEARIAALATEIYGCSEDGRTLPDASNWALASDGFVAEYESSTPGRTAMVVGSVAFAIGVLIALVMVTGDPASAPIAAAPDTIVSNLGGLELRALEHERLHDQLIVRGTLDHVPAQSESDPLTAVVALLRPDGGLIANARATVVPNPLTPEAEGNFEVRVPGATEIGRYRVSFQRHDQAVPYLDRRTTQ